MKKTIGVLAHVDSGKTTFCEQILYYTKAIRKLGRVDHKDSFLDNDEIEKERGITVFSEIANFDYEDSTYFLVDTPGHFDFSCEMERALRVLDYAVIIISAPRKVEGHTKTIFKLLDKMNIPVFIFVNKMDRPECDKEEVLANIKRNLSENIIPINKENVNCNKLVIEDELCENVCMYDENLMEQYLEGNNIEPIFQESLKKIVKERRAFPVMFGSALNDEGVKEFLWLLHIITYTSYEERKNNKFTGVVYKIKHDQSNTRVTYIKCLEGGLGPKDSVEYLNHKEEVCNEKINSIKIYNGLKGRVINKADSGDIVAVTGLSDCFVGDYIGAKKKRHDFSITPVLMSKVIFDNKLNSREVLEIFKTIEKEEPELSVEWNEELMEIHISIMGRIQLEILKEMILRRFKINVDFGKCKILYRETINSTIYGRGHYEPLKHYAEVHLKMEPLKRGTGITFESQCHVDTLSLNYQNLIKTHIFEKKHKGVLCGAPITDIKFTLVCGRSHLKHTCGGDFRQAVYRGIRQGLYKADSILLEPYYRFEIIVPLEYTGRVISDISKLSGTFDDPISDKDNVNVIIRGRGPVGSFMDYYLDVIAYSKGKGQMNYANDGYDVCHNTEEVIKVIGYDRTLDKENTPNSVFCSHGSGYTVLWNEADEKMHCEGNY